MDLNNFNRLLSSRYAPSSAFLRFDPLKLFTYFKAGSIIVKRKVTSKSTKTVQVVKIPNTTQKEIYRNLCLMKPKPYTIGISGSPTDILAQQTATSILYSVLNRYPGLEWDWLNTAYPKQRTIDPKLVIIYNVVPEYERIYKIRDLIDKYPKALKLVIVSGTNALDYFDNYIRYPLSGMINLTSTTYNVAKYVNIKKQERELPVFTDDILDIMEPYADKVKKVK